MLYNDMRRLSDRLSWLALGADLMSGAMVGRHAAITPTDASIVVQTHGGVLAAVIWSELLIIDVTRSLTSGDSESDSLTGRITFLRA